MILMMTTTPDRLAIPFVGPFGVMCAAVEALSRTLAAELGAAWLWRRLPAVDRLTGGPRRAMGVHPPR